jgi:fucose 4-O-acetylase-like acetyltransferase
MNLQMIKSKNLAETNQRASKNIFIIRGFAIFLVILGHVIGDRDSGIRQLYSTDLMRLAQVYKFIYTFHMPIFFLASGFSFIVLSRSKHNLLDFIVSRARRLLLPLLCWAPIYYIFRSVTGKKEFSFFGLLQSVISADFIFWFFPAIFFASILGYLCLKRLNSWLLYGAISFLLFSISFYFQSSISVWCYFNSFYFLGCVLGLYLLNHPKKINFPIWLALMLILTILPTSFYLEGILLSPPVTKFISGLSSFVFLYIMVDARPIFFNPDFANSFFNTVEDIFSRFGEISMSVYLLHVIFSSCTRTLLAKCGILDPSIQFIVGFSMSALGPFVIHKLLHKNSLFLYSIGEAK